LPEIETIKLFRSSSPSPIQQDPSLNDLEHVLISNGLAIREKLELPFWDSLLLYMSNHPVDAPNLLKRVIFTIDKMSILFHSTRRL